MSNLHIEAMLLRIEELNAELERRKAAFNELDELTVKLAEAGFSAQEFHGKEFALRDNFAAKNTCWRMAAVKRYEIAIKDIKN